MSYRTVPPSLYRPLPPSEGYMVDVMVTKSVKTEDSLEPATIVEHRRIPLKEYSKMKGIPSSEDYQLRDMLKAGIIPEMVSVGGMLDSNDPTDLQNVGVRDSLFDKLTDMEPASEPAPEPTVVSPEPTPAATE